MELPPVGAAIRGTAAVAPRCVGHVLLRRGSSTVEQKHPVVVDPSPTTPTPNQKHPKIALVLLMLTGMILSPAKPRCRRNRIAAAGRQSVATL